MALVTYRESPGLSASDARLAKALHRAGHEALAIPWDADTDWALFDAVVIRSTWDYHLRPAAFAYWLDTLERAGARVWNDPRVVHWNMHKSYLLGLANAGLAVLPTELVPRGSCEPLGAIAQRRGWSDVVVKPAVGASATGVTVVRADEFEEAEERLRSLAAVGDCLLQPLVAEIAQGEWSLVFFRGEFSHAALKTPAPGDIRVQQRYGGSTQIASATPELIREAAGALRAAAKVCATTPEGLLYARVDGVIVESRFTLMELELIEPGLYLNLDGAEGTAESFAKAVVRGL